MASITVTDRTGKTTSIDAEAGLSVMEIVRDAGFPIEAICGGQCACATCHCLIDDAWTRRLDPPDDDETELAQSSEHYDAQRSRLTCQIPFTESLDGLTLTIAPED